MNTRRGLVPRSAKREGGFTLIEVLFALALMAVALAVLGNILKGSIGQAGYAREQRTGAILADQKMGQLLSVKDIELEPHSGQFEGYDGFDWSFESANKSLKITKPDNKEEEQGQFVEITLSVRIPGTDKPIKVVAHKPIDPAPASGTGGTGGTGGGGGGGGR